MMDLFRYALFYMNGSLWQKLKKPFFCLAPMADVTDPAYRYIIAKYGKPDVLYTQFVSCDGLCSEGRDVLIRDLAYEEIERPIVAQFFGSNPEKFYECAKLAQKLKFDGIDVNMGCPDKNVMKQGGGAALIRSPDIAKKIIRATKEGAGHLPVSVKTRIGDTMNEIKSWIPALLEERPDVIAIHARTRKDMSTTPARWEYVSEAVDIARGSGTLIVGNGDLLSVAEGRKKCAETGADGAMLGKAIFGNPWLFNSSLHLSDIPFDKRLSVMVEHTKVFSKKLGDIKNFAVMRKHFKAYLSGMTGTKGLRMSLMSSRDSNDVEGTVDRFANTTYKTLAVR